MKRRAICLIGLSLLLAGCAVDKEETKEIEMKVENEEILAEPEKEEPANHPVFYTKSLDALENEGELNPADYYITNRVTAGNHYYIDENAVLWGEGQNNYGQLGNGEVSEADPFAMTTEPVRIAENVISVDCSGNSYFTIYLTSEGELYGMGINIAGLLDKNVLGKVSSIDDYNKVPVPVLLMEDVAYARAGRESIVALKEDGSVWWWGQYQSVYLTEPGVYEDYWTSVEDETNKTKMLYNSPKKILDDCIYVTTGDWTGAAIGKNGDLYTWGLNVFGECGVPVSDDDYVRVPQKVLEDVRMVWVDEIRFNNIENEIPEMMDLSTNYIMNMFVELESGEILASGQNIGMQEKTIGLTEDLQEESTYTYSDTFIPVEIIDENEMIKDTISEIKIGMSMDEVSKLLMDRDIQPSLGYYPNPFGDPGQDVNVLILANAEREYRLLFDEERKFVEVLDEE